MFISTLLAAVAAAALAALANAVVRRAGRAGIVFWGPVCEEGFKTGMALFLNASVPGTHLAFGLVEAAGDYAWGGRKKFFAALSGIAAHTVFGLATYFLISAGLPAYISVLGSIALHVAWNCTIIKISG